MTSQRKVSFLSNSIKVVGILFSPPETAPNRQHAAIVVSHPYDCGREPVAANYASLLAENGFITLAFDSAHYGESGGHPRYVENPYQRAEDIKSGVTYLSQHDFVDIERIGALGICVGGGYAAIAAQTDLRIKAVAAVSAACMGALAREGIVGTEYELSKDQVRETLKKAGDTRNAEVNGGAAITHNVFPGSNGKSDIKSVDAMVNYDSFAFVDWISPRPILLIAGGEADTRYQSEKAIERAKEPKSLWF